MDLISRHSRGSDPTPPHYPLWRGNDWNGFWTLLAENLAALVLVSVMLVRLHHMPERLLFGRILPGLGLGLATGMAFFAWQAVRLARRTRRTDVTALPYGISLPTVLLYVVGVLGPLYQDALQRGAGPDEAAVAAWQGGLAAVSLVGIIECAGCLLVPWLRRVLPRAAMLGSLAGVALIFIATVPLAAIFEHPYVGFPCMAVLMLGLVAGFRLPFGLPAGLAAVGLGLGLGFATGLSSLPGEVLIRPSLPLPVLGDWLRGWQLLWDNSVAWLVVVPVALSHLWLTTLNLESADADGDPFPSRSMTFLSGLSCIVGSLCGACIPTTCAVGHPAYKRLGAGSGYGLGAGAALLLLTATGLTGFTFEFIPAAALGPLLVFLGLMVAAQAFACAPGQLSMAVAVALIPHLSYLVMVRVQGALAAAHVPLDGDLIRSFLSEQGVHWNGEAALAGGAIITGTLWGAMTASVLSNKMHRAAGFSLLACLLSALGLMHNARLTFFLGPVSAGYFFLAIVFQACGVMHLEPPARVRRLELVPAPEASPEPEPEPAAEAPPE